MLLKRLLRNLGATEGTGPVAVRDGARVQPLPGFNSLVHGRHGVFVANPNDFYVGRALVEYGEYGEIESRFLQAYCGRGDVVVEVGANIGAHSVCLAKQVAPEGRLVAIEPQPFLFQTLCANVALNCLANVDTFNCACGNGEGPLAFDAVDYAAGGNFGGVEMRTRQNVAGGVQVEVRALDAILRGESRVDLIKIDVEGMEQEVLESARDTIARLRPALYVENDRIDKSASLIELVWALDYRAWWHVPALFNPDNYFGNAHDLYPGIGSCNMLCLPSGAEPRDTRDLQPVLDPAFHPFAK